jgi:hypothetical protein
MRSFYPCEVLSERHGHGEKNHPARRRALVGPNFDFTPTALDVVIEGGRIRGIGPTAGESADEVIGLGRRPRPE